MIRLSPRDLIQTSLAGPRSRKLRTTLSALGIAVGIGALTAISGVAASDRAQLLAQLDALGADLIVVTPGMGADSEPVPLPETAPALVGKIDDVRAVGVLRSVPEGTNVYRNDLVPSLQTNGLSVAAADPDFLTAISAELASGEWFDEATRSLPVTVLGSSAAVRLGVTEPGVRVWIGDRWYAVIGILADAGLAEDLNATAFLGDAWTESELSAVDDETIAALYVRSESGQMTAVREIVANAANPGHPEYVSVASLGELGDARGVTDTALSSLALGLTAIALLVGGIGIANTMVVAVLERRGEIGLRRALGARPGQIAAQFVGEAILISGLGGLAGSILGTLTVVAIAVSRGSLPVVPIEVLAGGPAVAVAVGVVAGLYPAASAARLSPTVALRSV